MREFDVIIVGAGLMGSFAARHLATRGYNVAVLERENDVSMGISRANTAIVYAGYDMKPGTLKAKLTVRGNACFESLCDELGVDFERTGSLMLASGPLSQKVLEKKLRQGQESGVPGLRLLNASEVQSLEPGLTSCVVGALYAPTTGTVSPWQLCLAAARDAMQHGASFFFEHEVVAIERDYTVGCSNGSSYCAPVVVNCAGIDADRVSELVAPVSFRLKLSSGSYLMLDAPVSKESSSCFSPFPYAPRHIIFFEPEAKRKGATLVPTTDGALLLGPSEEDLEQSNREPGYATESAGLDFVRTQSRAVFPGLPLEQTFRSFGTLRPSIHWAQADADGSVEISSESIHDFYLAWANECPGFLNVAGIKTPGLTCADGIGAYAADMVEAYLGGQGTGDRRGRFLCHRSSVTEEPSPSVILCRCKQVTYGEARAAIRTELGARTVDGVKRRVGCGLGRCQGGFCMERVMLLLAEELGCSPTEIIKDRSGSWIARSKPGTERDGAIVPVLPNGKTGTIAPSLCPTLHPRLLIVGGGAAGLSAACAAHEAGVTANDILLVDRLDALGGILPQCSHHGFGNREHGGTLSGPEFLAPLLKEFDERALPAMLNTMVTSLTPTRTVNLAGSAGNSSLEVEAIVFATGCRERPFGTLPIAGTRPSGIFTAGAAQRMVNLQHWGIGERIVILGSGDVGMVMAETLTQQGKQVLALVEQAPQATGLAVNYERYVEANGIPLFAESTVSRVFGHRRLEGVEITRQNVSAPSVFLACDTLIVSVGLIPEVDLLNEVLQENPSPPWLFLAGNAKRVHSFIEGVVADGKTAGAQAASYLRG